MADQLPREQTHRTDIPGLAGDADFCGQCNDYCGGDYAQCVCCGGQGTGARVESGELSVDELRDEQAGAADPTGGTQVSPAAGPPRVTGQRVTPPPAVGEGQPPQQ